MHEKIGRGARDKRGALQWGST